MPRITPLTKDEATGKAAQLLDQVHGSMGTVPNLLATLARGPAALEFYLASSKALSGGQLTAQLREQIAVAVAGLNACEYCASAHTFIGSKLGLSDDELKANLEGESDDPKAAAALAFARAIVTSRGWVSEEDVDAVRKAGYSDGEILELIAVVVFNIFTNYANHIIQPQNDFPRVAVGEPVRA